MGMFGPTTTGTSCGDLIGQNQQSRIGRPASGVGIGSIEGNCFFPLPDAGGVQQLTVRPLAPRRNEFGKVNMWISWIRALLLFR